ncbi:hypothetical protein NEQG_02087 [Nematocida parisii ERTm3]|uniref:Uncharacterized protein n=1 Tax=Nematocida parisii (strain ERTm3) TaxID=935791 RepID=I3EE93_NEMP3|nr:hypothetical protein NEQG_02087 [Nematocida parisii ERTm3]
MHSLHYLKTVFFLKMQSIKVNTLKKRLILSVLSTGYLLLICLDVCMCIIPGSKEEMKELNRSAGVDSSTSNASRTEIVCQERVDSSEIVNILNALNQPDIDSSTCGSSKCNLSLSGEDDSQLDALSSDKEDNSFSSDDTGDASAINAQIEDASLGTQQSTSTENMQSLSAGREKSADGTSDASERNETDGLGSLEFLQRRVEMPQTDEELRLIQKLLGIAQDEIYHLRMYDYIAIPKSAPIRFIFSWALGAQPFEQENRPVPPIVTNWISSQLRWLKPSMLGPPSIKIIQNNASHGYFTGCIIRRFQVSLRSPDGKSSEHFTGSFQAHFLIFMRALYRQGLYFSIDQLNTLGKAEEHPTSIGG